jgi:hypothetical protein
MASTDGAKPGTTERRVGLICNADHEIFGAVAGRLRERGIAVTFVEPGRRVPDDELVGFDLLMNKKVDPNALDSLTRAARLGIPTWNGHRTILLGVRLVGYRTLERCGFRVPPVHRSAPDCDHVAKTHVDWHFCPDPELNGEGDLYQELVPAEPVDYKYYAVDTGEEIVVRVLETTSKLQGEKRPLRLSAPEPDLERKVERLLRRTDTQALGVDCVRADGTYWAVDVNPAMSFRNAEMVPELVQSVEARLARTDAPPDIGTERRAQDPLGQ